MLCSSCGTPIAQGTNFCPMCGTPVASTSQTYNSYGSHDAASAGPTPVDSYDSYTYDSSGPTSTGAYGTTGSINYDTSEWPQASSLNQQYDTGTYGAPSGGFPLPVGMLVWSIIMIFFSGILGIIAAVFCVLAKGETTRGGYERKVKVAKVLNVIGTVLVIFMFLCAGIGGCAAFLLADSDEYADTFDGIVQQYDGDIDNEALKELFEEIDSAND